jgi:cytochrome oxidase Cu insertion factor (SCO1/SenC/PrrC family)
MELKMADTQEAPALNEAPVITDEGSIASAQQALLGLLESEDQPETEDATPTEEELASTDEDPDDSPEAVSEDESESEEEEEESESEESDEDEEDPVFSIKVDGEDLEVSLDELLKGYSRNSSFTRKSQALAEDRKQIETLQSQYTQEMQQIQAERAQYAQHLQSVIENSNLDQFGTVDWDRLKTEDPIAFLEKKEEFREAQENVVRVQHAQQAAMAKNQESQQHQWQESVRSEHAALVEKLPEWGDPGKQKELAGELRSYASSIGFQNAEIESLIDHRSFIVLNKARLYDEMQKANPKAKKLKNKPKVIRGSKAVTAKSQSKSKRAALRNRLSKTGNVNDAASLLEDFV